MMEVSVVMVLVMAVAVIVVAGLAGILEVLRVVVELPAGFMEVSMVAVVDVGIIIRVLVVRTVLVVVAEGDGYRTRAFMVVALVVV